jgi:hypothetical protein
MKTLLIGTALAMLATAPALAQVPVYTNADLGKPRHVFTPALTADEYRSLLAHQFVYVPTRPSWYWFDHGPSVAIAATPSSPYDSFASLPAPTRLDGTPYTQPPWEMRAYVGRRFTPGERPFTVGRRRHD